MTEPRLALIVPTLDRPHHLRRLLASLLSQRDRLHQLLVVDASKKPVEAVLAEFPEIPIEYVRVRPPNLLRQREAALRRIPQSTTHVGFLDDDIELLDGALDRMMAFWRRAAPDVAGARFNIVNERPPDALLLRSLLGLDSRRRGRVRRSGYNASLAPTEADLQVDWLSGGATVWRRGVLDRFKPDPWFEAMTFLEDVDFSFTIGRTHRLVVVGDARVTHHSPDIHSERGRLLGYQEVVNRHYFVSKHRELGLVAFYVATTARLGANLARLALRRDPTRWERTKGTIEGLRDAVLGRVRKRGGYWK